MNSKPQSPATPFKGLLFIGDSFFYTTDGANPFEALPTDLRATVVNCETVLTEKAMDAPAADWKLIRIVRKSGEICHEAINACDIFLLSNNHTMDLGVEGLEATAQWLRLRGKTAVGTRTHRHTELTISGQRVGVYAFADIPGRKYRLFPDEKQALKDISALKAKFDFLVVGVHWGREYADYPSPQQRRLAKRLIEHGADLIVGHHPHIFQGVEFFNGRPVYYSIGNCNFGTWQNCFSPWSSISLAVTCDFLNGEACFKELFYRINDCLKLEPLSEDEEQRCRERFQSISSHWIQLSWIQWGMRTSEVFVRQEKDALRRRFRNGGVRPYFVLGYWFSRPMTIFLLLSYMIRKTLGFFLRSRLGAVL